MGVEQQWENEGKTAIRLVVTDPWNWNDFHKGMHMAAIMLVNVDHPVHLVVEFSGTETMPAGALAHLRSLGKKKHERLSGHVVLINVPSELMVRITGGDDNREVTINESELHFVDDEAAARKTLASLAAS